MNGHQQIGAFLDALHEEQDAERDLHAAQKRYGDEHPNQIDLDFPTGEIRDLYSVWEHAAHHRVALQHRIAEALDGR